MVASARTLAEAFASPSYLSSARSYQSLIKYGYRHPAPSLWLLTQNTNDAIFEPWASISKGVQRIWGVASRFIGGRGSKSCI
jgi:hypothetical protein